MISGINTDVKVGDIVYHVQTEDKGQKSRLLLSLVYDKGTILASKRVTYDDVLKGVDFDENKLAEYLNRQHQLICAAVSAGRIEQLKAMTGKARAEAAGQAPAQTPLADAQPAPAPPIQTAPREPAPAETAPVAPAPARPTELPAPMIPMPSVPLTGDQALDELIIDAIEILDDDLILEAEAVEVVSELSGRQRPTNNKITIELLGETKFKGGDRKTVNIMVCRGTERKVVPGAEIMVKVLGSSFRPVIFHSRSDGNGLAKVHLQLPKFDSGRAALLVRAIASGEEIELRRIVNPG